MPAAIPLHRHLHDHLAPPPARAPETDEARRNRQLDLTRELTDLNMLAVRDAAHRIAQRDPTGPSDTPAADNPTLALARATRAVTTVINLENHIAAGETTTAAKTFAVEDPRGLALRQLLHPLVAHEPDPVRRRTLKASINDRIDGALLDEDLGDDIPLADVGIVIAREHGLTLDISKVEDRYLLPPFQPVPDWRAKAFDRDQR